MWPCRRSRCVPSCPPGLVCYSRCHSCGAISPGTKTGRWIGDHQPPTRIVSPGTPQELHPQCSACSNQQGLWIINLVRQGLPWRHLRKSRGRVIMLLGELTAAFPWGVLLVTDDASSEQIPSWASKTSCH